jgi:LysR family transcriptional regulator, cys regulon transcriptional activator
MSGLAPHAGWARSWIPTFMRLEQLRYVVEIAKHGNHLSAAAAAMYTSQPGVSRQIRLLEHELGFAIFIRTRKRIIGLTEAGERVLEIANRVVADANSLSSFKDDFLSTDHGVLRIATTYAQANYVLPGVIGPFMRSFPDVQIVLKQSDPEKICEYVIDNEADLAIGTDTRREFAGLVNLPCMEMKRSVVAPVGHPILECEELTLEEIAKFPIITYDPRYSGRWKTMRAFEAAGLEPKITLTAVDASVCKTYVRLGLGISILTTVNFSAGKDKGLALRDASHLFESSVCYVRMRSNTYPRVYTLEFIRRLAPQLTADVIKDALRNAVSQPLRSSRPHCGGTAPEQVITDGHVRAPKFSLIRPATAAPDDPAPARCNSSDT